MRPKVLLVSAARTASPTMTAEEQVDFRGIELFIRCSAVGAAPSVVVTIQAIDPVSGQAVTILASAAIVAAGNTRMRVYPGIAVAANASASDVLPHKFKVDVAHANSDSITYSIHQTLLP